MSKQLLVDAIAEANGLTKRAAGDVIETVFTKIQSELKANGKFGLVGFGTFTVRKRAARKGRNPATGEAMKVKASKSVGFKNSASLKAAL